jgi:GNAT superfamily N-acetyltransferase
VGYWQLALDASGRAPEAIRPVADVWPKVRRAREVGAELEREPLASDVARALIGALDGELSATYPEPGATHFRLDAAEVSGDGGAFLVARLEGEPVGCGAVRVAGDGVAELKRMFVVPRWRGVGISRTILAALEGRAREAGAGRVVLETGARQREALALYERAGYVRCAPFGEYVGSPLSVCMTRTLG